MGYLSISPFAGRVITFFFAINFYRLLPIFSSFCMYKKDMITGKITPTMILIILLCKLISKELSYLK